MVSGKINTLIEHDFEGFETFANSIASAFPIDKHGCVALLSPSINNENYLVPISHVGKDLGKKILVSDLRKKVAYFDEFIINKCKLYVIIEENFSPKNRSILGKLLKAAMIRLWGERQAAIRQEIIKQTVRSRDVNSFLHRVVHGIADNFIKADEISIFTEDKIRQSLSLSATTRKIEGIQKKDIYYMINDHSPITECFTKGTTSADDNGKKIPSEHWDTHLYRGNIYTRLILPLGLPDHYLPDRPNDLGVIRISNFRYSGKVFHQYCLTEYDLMVARFLSEVIFVLIQQYLQYQEHEQEVSRLTHGLGANIDAAIKFYDNCREMLFETAPPTNTKLERKFYLTNGDIQDEDNFTNYFNDLGSFVDDLHFQFNNATSVAGALDLDGIISDFHTEILMPVLRVAPSIALIHNRSSPKFNNFKKAGSLDIPTLHGNVDALISVFRNLVDNSIKYNDNKVARIEIVFRRGSKFMDMIYCDNGIGIPEKEQERVFIQGFRTDEARRRTFSGAGIGLSYSREIMEAVGGSLDCLPYNRGARFQLRLVING